MSSKKHAKGVKKSSKSKKVKTQGGYQSGRKNTSPPVEVKALDLANTFTGFLSVGAGAGIKFLNPVVVGAELYQRTGRKIYMKSIQIRGHIYSLASSVLDEGALRTLLVYDAQPNTGTPLIADIIKDANAGAATSVFSSVNLDNRQRFKVLREWNWHMGSTAANFGGQGIATGQTTIQDGSQCIHINEYVKLGGLEAVFNAVNGGTVADIVSGALFLVNISDTNVTGCWTLNYSTRLRYKD